MSDVVLSVSFEADPEYRAKATVQGVAEQLIEMAPKLAAQRLKIQAMIKRLIHAEKLSVYQRVYQNLKLFQEDPEFLLSKIETHKEFYSKPDEQIVTW